MTELAYEALTDKLLQDEVLVRNVLLAPEEAVI